MPADYRLFHVATYTVKPGKHREAQVWTEQALELYASFPGVQGIKAYATQFGLGPDGGGIEFWTEIDDYGVMDKWDDVIPDKAEELYKLSELEAECVNAGPARLMGDYPGSAIEQLSQG